MRAAGRDGRGVQPLPEPDRAWPAQTKRGHPAADRQGAAYLGGGALRAGRDPGRPAGRLRFRSALLADAELSERQKQVLIEIYESFRPGERSRQQERAGRSGRARRGGPDLADGAPGAEEAFLAEMTTEMANQAAAEQATPYAPGPEVADAGSEPGAAS